MAITYVGKVGSSSSASGGASSTITVGAGGVALNDRIIIAALVGNGTATPSVPTDSGGNTYVLDNSVVIGTDSMWVWSANASTALVNGNTIVVNLPTGNTEFIVIIEEYSGIATSGYGDGTNAGAQTANNNATSGNVTTTNANDLLFGAVGLFTGSTTVTWLNSFLHRDQTSLGTSPTADLLDTADNIVSATSTYAAAATLSGSPEWLAILTTYKAVASGSATTALISQQRAWRLRRGPFWHTTASGTTFDPQNISQIPQYPWGLIGGHHFRIQTKVLSSPGFNSFVQTFTAVLTFTGPTNLTKATGKGMTAGLSFTGPTNLKNAIAKGLSAATLSFTGPTNLKNAVNKLLVGATLTFTGANLQKVTGKLLSGTLSFTGPTKLLNAINKKMTGTLSFTGPANLRIAVNKLLAAATLTFNGSLIRATAKQLAGAVLTFTGAALTVGRHFVQALSGALGFTGALTKNTGKSLTGSLSFTGAALTKQIVKGLTAGLSFTGSLRRAIQIHFTAGLSFTGSLIKNVFSAVSSFVYATLVTRKSMIHLMARTGAQLIATRSAKVLLRSRNAAAISLIRKAINNLRTR